MNKTKKEIYFPKICTKDYTFEKSQLKKGKSTKYVLRFTLLKKPMVFDTFNGRVQACKSFNSMLKNAKDC